MHGKDVVGEITTNRSMSIEECLDILDVNPDEMLDENTPKWNYDSFFMVAHVELDADEARELANAINGYIGEQPPDYDDYIAEQERIADQVVDGMEQDRDDHYMMREF
jgi:hypothetical protein